MRWTKSVKYFETSKRERVKSYPPRKFGYLLHCSICVNLQSLITYGCSFMTDITFSVRIPQETKTMLDALSKSTQRSKNFLAREAIMKFVQSEAEIVEDIMQGLEDVKAGRTVPHEDVVKTSRAIIADAHRRKAKQK